MIGYLCEAVASELKARKYPHPVVYGPERTQRRGFTLGIVFERDRSRTDAIVKPTGATHTNPGVPFDRKFAGSFRLYATSSKPGAGTREHEDACDMTCDAVICAMYRVLKARRLGLEIVTSRLLKAEEIAGQPVEIETWAGCAAIVQFNVVAQVRDVDYLGHGPATGEPIASVHAPLVVSDGFPDFDPVEN